jgi:hypothetical protein
LPTFLIEFDSAQAACAHLASTRLRKGASDKIVLINPAAQEYLQPAQPARDPDLMPPAPAAAVTLPPWKLLLHYSDHISAKTQELGPSAEKDLRRAVKMFGRELRDRHKNAMILRFEVPPQTEEQLLTAATRIASDYNFINPALAENGRVTLAFVPLSVDPPAAMHYATVVEQLSSEFEGLKTVICPREVNQYLGVPIAGRGWRLIQAIKKMFWHPGA